MLPCLILVSCLGVFGLAWGEAGRLDRGRAWIAAAAAEPEPSAPEQQEPNRRFSAPERGAYLMRRIVVERQPDGRVRQTVRLGLAFSDGKGTVRAESDGEVTIQTATRVVNLSARASDRGRAPRPEASRMSEVEERAIRVFSRCRPSLRDAPQVFVVREPIPGERTILSVTCTGLRQVYTISAGQGSPASEWVYEEWRDARTQRLVQTVQAQGDGSRTETSYSYVLNIPVEDAMFEVPE